MASITWDSGLETGIEEIDGQHRVLIDTFNRLAAAVGRVDASREELEGILEFLRECAMLHFQTEQELMARHRYPYENEHRRLHADLVSEMEEVLEGFHRGGRALTPVTLEYLDEWIVRHIREEDLRLAEFLRHATV